MRGDFSEVGAGLIQQYSSRSVLWRSCHGDFSEVGAGFIPARFHVLHEVCGHSVLSRDARALSILGARAGVNPAPTKSRPALSELCWGLSPPVFQALREVRGDPELAAIPVVMTSGMDVSDQCKDAGASAFVLKPYDPEVLASVLLEQLQDSGD